MKDVTQVIKEARDKGHLLVSVELDLGQQYQKRVQERLSAGNMPYLLLYTDDKSLAEPNSVATSLQRYDPFSEGGETFQGSPRLHRPNSSPELKERMRREATLLPDPIQNNELPEVDYRPDGYRKDDLWESTWYLALKPKSGRKEKKKKSQEDERRGVEQSRKAHESEVLTKEERTSEKINAADTTVKKVKDSRTVTDRRKHERKNEGKKQRGGANSQSPVLIFDEQTMRKARRRQWGDNQHRGCSRRNLRVDFADIGWSEWVIAPKAFDAYYCAGTCGFPMPKVRPQTSYSL